MLVLAALESGNVFTFSERVLHGCGRESTASGQAVCAAALESPCHSRDEEHEEHEEDVDSGSACEYCRFTTSRMVASSNLLWAGNSIVYWIGEISGTPSADCLRA